MSNEERYKFSYDTLEAPSAQIRLLKIVFSSTPETHGPAGEVRCELSTWSAHSLPSYIAVSYTWGPICPARCIFLNSTEFTVRANCWYVLAQAKSRQMKDYLWIDALCINQDDNSEKSSQVAIMGSIYRNATQVNICLGPEADNSTAVFEAINSHQQFVKSTADSFHETHQRQPEHLLGNQRNPRYAKLGLKESPGFETRTFEWFESLRVGHLDVIWQSLYALSRRSYFSRLWVVQELVLADCAVMLCGDACCDFNDFVHFYRDFILYDKDEWANNEALGFFNELVRPNLHHIRSALDSIIDPDTIMTRKTLFDLVYRFRRKQCSDKRDKIFGLLALVDWADQPPLKVDYQNSKVAVALQACSYLRPGMKNRPDIYEPLTMASRLLNALDVSADDPDVIVLLLRRQPLPVHWTTELPSIVGNPDPGFLRIEVPATGYCTLYTADGETGELIACLGDEFPTRTHCLHNLEHDISNFFPEHTQAFRSSIEQTLNRALITVSNLRGRVAMVSRNAQAGDMPLNIRQAGDYGKAFGLVVRQTHHDSPLYQIVGRAIFGPHVGTCYGAYDWELCTCNFDAKMHAQPGEQMVVYFEPEDLLAMISHGPKDIRQLETSVVPTGSPFSSYAAMIPWDKSWIPMNLDFYNHNLDWWKNDLMDSS